MQATENSAYGFCGRLVTSAMEALGRESPKNNRDHIFRSFVEKFYNFSYSADMELTGEFLLQVARGLYEFIRRRKRGESLVRVYEIEGPHFPSDALTIIETANDNLPFIVDSVMIAIKKHMPSIYHYTNAVLNMERDADGVISNVQAGKTSADDRACESVIYFVVGKTSEEQRKNLLDDVKKALGAVACCVQDWEAMQEKMVALADDLEKDPACAEECSLLRWMCAGNYVFLGYEEYENPEPSAKSSVLRLVTERSLGIPKIDVADRNPEKSVTHTGERLHVAQSDLVSYVHKRSYMTCLGLRTFNSKGMLEREYCFYGFFTSSVAFQSSADIPVVRRKVEYVAENSGFLRCGHNGKALFSIIQKFTREALFYFSEEELLQISMGMLSLSSNPKVKFFMLRNRANFIMCLIFIPKSIASTELAERVAKVLEEALCGSVVGRHYNMYNESEIVRLQFTIEVKAGATCDLSEKEIEKLVVDTASRWEDRLQQALQERMNGKFSEFVSAFPKSYQECFTPGGACHDIVKINLVMENGASEVDLYLLGDCGSYQLKIYVPLESEWNLAKVLDIVKKMGAKMVLHHSYDISVHGKGVRLHYFVLSNTHGSSDHHKVKNQFEMVLKKVFCREAENDNFNSLVILANLQWREVLLIRALNRYLKQIAFSYSQSYNQKVVRRYPQIIYLLVRLFEARFDPSIKDRDALVSAIKKSLEELFVQVTDVVHDYILKSIYNLIMAILRTNYYQGDKPYLSLKFDSEAVPDIPLPKPFRETYVYSNTVEGIHLRGGKVARGGIRWSDRTEDFRTEVLGLLKAQMTKNAVIVPVGSKGGFILKGESRKIGTMQCAVECYKNFLRGILDITDNIVDGKCTSPDNVVRYDDDDPYLVVAADKGTATFSDYANQVSAEYNFWLGDAFASGGSVGFDHKKIGVTARGAWCAAQRHFWEMKKDIAQETFTVVGIGDMSGDVFGNGMLLSEKIRLIGAFNHMHIFVDPSPDPEKSYAERKRLFEMPRSSWMDYSPEVISKGGGVFCRQSKSITLTPEIRKCLGIETGVKVVSPSNLITYMLKAPVDMIWNGGIGTYIRSSEESDVAVGDKANSHLRITAKDVRAAMMIEGGNLGCTQLGRVEYSRLGGKIYTDFTDNAGGVVCSDFEVNLKICLEMAVRDNFISLEERNKILDDMLYDVPNIVLESNNKLAIRALMLECAQAPRRAEQHQRLIQYLEKLKMLDRAIEFLPGDEEIQKMIAESRGFCAAQIAVLMAYTRTFIKGEIIRSNMLQRPGLDCVYESQYLLPYFPKEIRDRFGEYIRQHKLKYEILSTCITNDIVNRMGCVFASHVQGMGVSLPILTRVYVIITQIYNLADIWNEIDSVDLKVGVDDYILIIRKVQRFIGDSVFRLFRRLHKFQDIEKRLDVLSSQTSLLENNLSGMLCDTQKASYERACKSIPHGVVSPAIAKRVAVLEFSIYFMDIIHLAESWGVDVYVVGCMYFRLRSVLSFGRVLDLATQMDAAAPYWQRIAIRNLLDDFSDYQSIIAGNIIEHMVPKKPTMQDGEAIAKEAVAAWCAQHKDQLDRYYGFLEEINSTQLDLSKLFLVVRSLGVFTAAKDSGV